MPADTPTPLWGLWSDKHGWFDYGGHEPATTFAAKKDGCEVGSFRDGQVVKTFTILAYPHPPTRER